MLSKEGDEGLVRLTTRNVADFVRGASTCCGEMGTRWFEGVNVGGILAS